MPPCMTEEDALGIMVASMADDEVRSKLFGDAVAKAPQTVLLMMMVRNLANSS